MKAIFRATHFAALAIALLASTAMAQGPRGNMDPKKMLDRQVERMKSDLSLTADQEAKVRPILQESFDKMQSFRGKARDGSGPSPEMREEMGKIRQETHDKLAAVLSKDQMEKYEKIQQERRDRFHRDRANQ